MVGFFYSFSFFIRLTFQLCTFPLRLLFNFSDFQHYSYVPFSAFNCSENKFMILSWSAHYSVCLRYFSASFSVLLFSSSISSNWSTVFHFENNSFPPIRSNFSLEFSPSKYLITYPSLPTPRLILIMFYWMMCRLKTSKCNELFLFSDNVS